MLNQRVDKVPIHSFEIIGIIHPYISDTDNFFASFLQKFSLIFIFQLVSCLLPVFVLFGICTLHLAHIDESHRTCSGK